MKPLIIFYSICILMFYSLIMYIGHRNKNYKNESNGLLDDVTVSSAEYKISKAKLLSQNFDNVIIYSKMNESQMAANELYKAIMLLAKHSNSSEGYEHVVLNSLLKDMSSSYIELIRNKKTSLNMNKIFESSELFIAYGFIQRSKQEIKHKDTIDAMENITKAQECLALSAKYVKGEDLKLHKELLDETNQLLALVTQ